MTKPRNAATPEQLLKEATEGKDLTPAEMKLLVSGYNALKEYQNRPLSVNEHQAVLGMISYVAYTQNVREERVRAVLHSTYGVESIADIPSRFYQEIVEFLLDLQLLKLVN